MDQMKMIDLKGYDLIWRKKPDLPAANEENINLENSLKEKKIEIERYKVILQNNVDKGKNIREHYNDLFQTLSYKQELYRSKEHEVMIEVHAGRVLEREISRMQQEMKAISSEINTLTERQKRREREIEEQEEKKVKIKSSIELDEETLLKYLDKSAQVERDNMTLLKYSAEDDSRINELGLLIERLSRDVHERKSALDDASTDVVIVQSELDHMQEEFENAYKERMTLIDHWEKLINRIQFRNNAIVKLSQHLASVREEEIALKRNQREQEDLLSIEIARNNEIEIEIRQQDIIATKTRNDMKLVLKREEDLKAELSTIRNVLSNLLYQKEIVQNSLNQIEKQVQHKIMKCSEIKESIKNFESMIQTLAKENFDADHYTKQLEEILLKERKQCAALESYTLTIVKDILVHDSTISKLKTEEKMIENHIKNCQGEIRNLLCKMNQLDLIRAKQESEMYEIDSGLEMLRHRVQKMAGETNEDDKRRVEKERLLLLSTLEEQKKSAKMLTEELNFMMNKVNITLKELESNRRINNELEEKIKFLEYFIKNSQTTFNHCVSQKQELLVQECMERFRMKSYKKLLNKKNRTVISLQKRKLEFEAIMKKRIEELKYCKDLLMADIRTETEECNAAKKKLRECKNKIIKSQTKYKIILDALGISESGPDIEANLLLKAEDEKKDLQNERDKLMVSALKEEDDLSTLRNTIWMLNAANEQFRELLHPPGISLEDSEKLKSSETESQNLDIEIHTRKSEIKTLMQLVEKNKQKLEEEQNSGKELNEVIGDRENEIKSLRKELVDLDTKIRRAVRSDSRLKKSVMKKHPPDIEDDIRIHILREIRRNMSDLLFSAVEPLPNALSKILELYQEAGLPVPSRARSSSSLRSGSSLGLQSQASHSYSSPSSSRSSRTDGSAPSVVQLRLFPE